MSDRRIVIALSGGIGGAKLALGLSRVLSPEDLLVVANTGDDFEHLGLAISPDLDTLMYTLAGISDPERGWGLRDETWNFMTALRALGGEDWFQLGDRDLATHVERTRRLAAGDSLSQITGDYCRRLGIGARIVPMSDDPVRTRVGTEGHWLDFQDYFVRQRCEPAISGVMFHGADRAQAQPEILKALRDPALRCVVICPSNPLISIEPILAVPGLRSALVACAAPVIAVSPIIAGDAVKGPTAKMLRELGVPVTNDTIAQRYADFLDALVIDIGDAERPDRPGLTIRRAPTLMRTLEDREALASIVLTLADTLTCEEPSARAGDGT
jgi:LPPG:FO 2-phospho-L-lactate transferase